MMLIQINIGFFKKTTKKHNFSKLFRERELLLRTFVLGFLFNYDFTLDCNAASIYIRGYRDTRAIHTAKITCREFGTTVYA